MIKKNKINTNLILLLLGRMVSDTGTAIQMAVMPIYIIDIGGSAATVGLFSFLSFLPALLVYPFAGVMGDRWNRKAIMVSTDLISGAVILLLALSAYSERLTLPLLLLAQVAISLLNGLFGPATKGIVPQLADSENLSRANSAVASLRTLSSMAGPVIGMTLYMSFGVRVLFIVNGSSFVLSSCSEMMIRYIHKKKTEQINFFEELVDGFKFIFTQKTIYNLCFFLLVIYALIQPLFTIVLPLFFRTALKYPDAQYGYLQMIIVAGAFLGSVLVGVLFGKENKETKALSIGLLLLISTMLGFSALLFPNSLSLLGADTLLYFCIFSGALGLLSVSLMFINVPVQTIIQKKSSDKYMSRVFSVVGMITKGGLPFGGLIYGIILNRIEIYWTISASTLLIILVSGVFHFAFRNRELS
ncbi:MAG: MFS transporter [Firmicutes bacterium]|nr:MFS transporter [Bacillota bacterium]